MPTLEGVHPDLAAAVTRILAAMAALGYPMRVLEGLRSQARQTELYTHGRTAPGAIVTYANGITQPSAHQRQADGHGHAVDCCFAGATPWSGPWDVYGAAGRALGLRWGGDFVMRDRPHLELPVATSEEPPPVAA